MRRDGLRCGDVHMTILLRYVVTSESEREES